MKTYLIGIGLTILTFFTITAPSAFAEEKTKILPESGVTATGKGGEGKLVSKSGSAITCKKGTGSGTVESANSGKYKTLLEECELLGGRCTSTGQASGNVLNEGTYHFWLALETLNGTPETLVGASVGLPLEVHATCNVLGFNQLILVKGCDAALITPLNTLTSVVRATAAQVSTGVQLIIKVLPSESTKEIECILLSSINGGAFEQTSLVGVAETEKFKKGETMVTVLVMNPEGHE